ncbi:single-stranded DNA-binding protein [Sporomusa sphaeroides]|uniref:single-stranded DNA-binding protein n=1 Tax=Sporomusa sphaeroides TaxID=47679 RepID=UPI003DA0F19B
MNKFFLTGNLCADPTFTAGQEESKNRCNFRVAYNHSKDKATFFSCTVWGKNAEKVHKLKKGQRLLVEGDIEENEWTDQQTNSKQRDKQVNVRMVEYIDFPDQNAATAPPAQPGYAPPPAGYQPPAPGYGHPPTGYPPQQGYGAPPAGYQSPQQGYGAPPVQPGYGVPPQGYQQPPQGQAPMQQPPQQYVQPQQQPGQYPPPQQYKTGGPF